MKRIVLVLGLAACGTTPPEVEPDARVPADVDGTWQITWTCVECEPGSINPLAYATVLVIEAPTLTYDDAGCADCGDEHTGEPNADGTCITAEAGGPGGDELSWEAYTLCGFGNTLEGELTFTGFPGPPEPRTYRLAGSR